MGSLVFCTVISLLTSSAVSKEVTFDFTVSRFLAAPDGVVKEVIGVNGHSPGPTIRVSAGDLVVLRVTNLLDRGEHTSIHWHGIPQTWNNINDGVSWITQYPIPPGATYLYKFVAEKSGTYWYHSHHMEQWTDGLYGLIIVDDPPGVPKPYDGEFSLIINDHNHLPSPVIYDWFAPQTTMRRTQVPDTTLINGRGHYPCDFAERKGFLCEPSQQLRYGQIRVRPGLTYRIRILNAGPASSFMFQIDEHKFRVMETDGIRTKADKEYEQIRIVQAQRLSILVKMDQRNEEQFWFRFFPGDELLVDNLLDLPNLNPFPAVYQRLAYHNFVLKYDPKANLEAIDLEIAQPPYPNTIQKVLKGYPKDVDLLPIDSEPLMPSYFNESHNLFVTDNLGVRDGGSGFDYTKLDLRNVSEPALFQVVRGEKLPIQFNPVYVKGFGPNYIVEIIMNNVAQSGHPIHLHGHDFWIVGQGQYNDGLFYKDKYKAQIVQQGRVALRDTASLEKNSWLVFRFVANNPGVWLLHCHIDFHLGTGMGFVLVVGEEEIRKKFMPAQNLG